MIWRQETKTRHHFSTEDDICFDTLKLRVSRKPYVADVFPRNTKRPFFESVGTVFPSIPRIFRTAGQYNSWAFTHNLHRPVGIPFQIRKIVFLDCNDA